MSRTHRATLPVLFVALAMPWTACQQNDADTEAPASGLETGAAAMEDRAMMPPDTTAEALWAHLQGSEYRVNWDLWPGTTELYEGTEPHGMLLTTYVNATAAGALADGSGGDLPEGAIVVKENFAPDSTFAAATVMMKVDGYSADHQDWLFAKYQPDGTVDAFGRVDGCQGCHAQAEGGDYLYTALP